MFGEVSVTVNHKHSCSPNSPSEVYSRSSSNAFFEKNIYLRLSGKKCVYQNKSYQWGTRMKMVSLKWHHIQPLPHYVIKACWSATDRRTDWFLRGQLHDVPVAAVQRALGCCPVLCLVLWSDRVNDEAGCQVEGFGLLRLPRPTSCTSNTVDISVGF